MTELLTRRDVRGATRLLSLDALRGLAIACMIVDHAALLAQGAGVGPAVGLRYTVGRVALPLFFVLAGSLATGIRWRLLWVGLLGVVLGAVVPWSGAEQVLMYYAAGVVTIVLARRLAGERGVWAVLVVAVTALCNKWGMGPGYPVFGLWALMCIGGVIGRDRLAGFAGWLLRGRWAIALSTVGRHPLLWYAAHLLIFDAAAMWYGWGPYR